MGTWKRTCILKEIIDAAPTDGLWDDGRTDEGQLGLKYEELEEALNNPNSPNRAKYETIRKQNLHKMEPIPVCKILLNQIDSQIYILSIFLK